MNEGPITPRAEDRYARSLSTSAIHELIATLRRGTQIRYGTSTKRSSQLEQALRRELSARTNQQTDLRLGSPRARTRVVL